MELGKILHLRPQKDNVNAHFNANSAIATSEVLHFEFCMLHSSWGIFLRPNRLKVIKLLKTFSL